MYSACGNAALPALGFPIRVSTDHRLFSAYPWLIAAVHALHRLLVPRHPPCALPILTVIRPLHIANALARLARSGPVIPVGVTLTRNACWQFCAVFKVRGEGAGRTGRTVSQNSTACERAARERTAHQRYPIGFAGGHTRPNRLRRRAQAGSVDIARTWPLIALRYAARGGSGAPILEASLERR